MSYEKILSFYNSAMVKRFTVKVTVRFWDERVSFLDLRVEWKQRRGGGRKWHRQEKKRDTNAAQTRIVWELEGPELVHPLGVSVVGFSPAKKAAIDLLKRAWDGVFNRGENSRAVILHNRPVVWWRER